MIKITRWSPDTCKCIIEYSWDSDLPAEERVHTVSNVIPCEFHKNKPIEEIFNEVKEENTRKNRFYADIVENIPRLKEVTADGAEIIKKEANFRFSFDESRNLKVDIDGLTALEQDSLQNLAESKYGAEKIKLNPIKENGKDIIR